MTVSEAPGGLETGEGSRCSPLVGFLGPRASYSHQASLQAFPEEQWHLCPMVTIPDIFTAVQSGAVTYGVVPFENSTNGSVLFTLDCFADRDAQSPDVAVCGEIYLDVHHFLIGRPPPPSNHSITSAAAAAAAAISSSDDAAGSGTCTPTASDPHPPKPRSRPRCDLSHVRRLYSHPQAWGQCSAFLAAYLKGVETMDVSSTSRAAELVAEDDTGASAAVSSRIAAELHGVDVLAANIEDREDNTTRFFVIRKEEEANGGGGRGEEGEGRGEGGKGGTSGLGKRDNDKTKSMVSFVVPHEAPGALADVLECFRSAGLNLTSINSRPSLEKPFQYVFFVEFQGHRWQDPEGRVRRALEGVAGVAEAWRWLGSWDDQRA